MAIGEPIPISSALSSLKQILTFSEDTQAQIEDAIETTPVVVEAPLPFPAEIPASNVINQRSLAVTPAKTFEVPIRTIVGTPTSSEVESQLTESTSVVVETPRSITASEIPTTSEVEQQLSAVTRAEAPEALNTDWYGHPFYEMDIG